MSLSILAIVLFPFISGAPAAEAPAELDPPEIRIGEALFMDTRFAEYFATHATGVNEPLEYGDPVMDFTETTHGPLPGPFRGKSMSCRACHLVDEFAETPEQPGAPQGGMRTYADFAQRSPIPHRADGLTHTLRNAPSQVNASVAREFMFLHGDGEFITMEDLVRGSLQSRNFGWLKGEEPRALAHIARVIREDHGKHPLADEDAAFAAFSYGDLFRGTAPGLPAELTLPDAYRIDPATATDVQIMDAIAKLVAVYVTDLAFSQDDAGYNLSPYDAFLHKNGLPLKPDTDESPLRYNQRLLAAVEALGEPAWVCSDDGAFAHHSQLFQFGQAELDGLKIFLRTPTSVDTHEGSVGNCAACHPAPHFTDFGFHNTGTAQEEYDAIYGAGAFANVAVPSDKDRVGIINTTSGNNPFAEIPTLEHPGHTDLGLWNVFLNPAFPRPQAQLLALLQRENPGIADPEALLATTLAAFKTPGLRDLGHSDPYFHTGRFNNLESAIRFYRQCSELARHDGVRNADPELRSVHLEAGDEAKLAAFLRALNEDYE